MSEVAVVEYIAKAAAEIFLEATAGAVAARGTANVALTGGSTAAPLYAELQNWAVPWPALQNFFTDERAVPPDHPLSNYRLADDGILPNLRPDRIHRLYGEAKDLDAEAARAAADLRSTLGTPPRFDLVLLGLGPDGHILSLFAGVPSSGLRGEELVRHVAAPLQVEPKVARLTLTPMLVMTARTVVLQVAGAAKAPVLARALKGPEDLVACPAQWLRRASGRVVIVADAAAAAGL